MNYFKRARISNRRNLGKTILFFLLIVLLCSVIGASIFVNQAVINTEQNLLNKLPPVATIRAGQEEVSEIWEQTGEWPAMSLTREQIQRVAALPYVRSYDFFSTANLYSDTLEPFSRTGSTVGSREEWGHRWWIRGVQNPDIRDIQEGNIELIYGRTFTTSEVELLSTVALISEEVATQNGLVVGSTISLRNVVIDWDEQDGAFEQNIIGDETYNVEIIGIFRPLTTDSVEALVKLDNLIYTPNTFVEMANRLRRTAWAKTGDSAEFDEHHVATYDNIFTLYSSHDLPAFREAAVFGIPRQFFVYDAGNPFHDVATAMETMLNMASFILYLTIAVSILVLSLLITVLLHDRKREIGIYLSVGVKKSHILLQFALEFISVAAVGIVVALFIGEYISQIISRVLIMSEAMAYQTAETMGFFGMDTLMQREFQADIAVGGLMDGIGFHPELVLTFLVIGIGTTILSTIGPLIYVLRLDPKKIMM